MIPKVIHYCWFGGKPLPNEVKACIASWKKFAPDYRIIEWNEKNFDVEGHPFVKAAYVSKAWAFVSDYARLKVIYENGGIYFDTDVELLKNPDILLENECYIGVQQLGQICTTGLGFGAVKSSIVVRDMLEKYNEITFDIEKKIQLACPSLNNEIIEKYGYKFTSEVWKSDLLTVYPSRFFDPISPGDSENLLCEETISIHHYSASWMGFKNRFKRKLFNLIGDANIHRLKKILNFRRKNESKG